MSMKNYIPLSLMALCMPFHAQAQSDGSSIEGDSRMQIDAVSSFRVSENDAVQAYRWIAPVGCRIEQGQGTPEVKVRSTFLAQDSPLRVLRTFPDNHVDTLSCDIAFVRYVRSFKDYTIAPGESVNIGGVLRSDADIYYTPAEGGDAGQVIAHRVTVQPEAGKYVEMTRPYLQTATSSSIWISWKTSFENAPLIRFGTSADRLDGETAGSAMDMSVEGQPYYWNSVQLTGLQPNTVYYYQAVSGEKKSEVYRFRTMPEEGSKTSMRILLMGDHQIKSRSGYEWLMQAAQRKIEEKYGNLEENINMVMNIGDQVDVGTLDQYEQIHLFKSQQMSPYLPIMTAVGNHETYSDPGMRNYAAHNHYENLAYKGISSGTENYYAYQAGRILFVVLSTEHTGSEQKAWVRKVVDAAKDDDSVDFIISVNHRPIQAEQYIGDISPWVRNEIVPILSETPKHVLNYGGHHHLYHRGQLADYPLYHIINGAASWDQMWGMSSEKDYDDVQKTIDYWGYQILEFDFEKKEMKAECYAIGNKALVVDNILIDSFHRTLGQSGPDRPQLGEIAEEVQLPYEFSGSAYSAASGEKLNTVQFQFSTKEDFSTVELNSIRDVENLYGSTGAPLYLPVDVNENVDITRLTVDNYRLKNGNYYVRVRYRDTNMEWSEWSDVKTFKVVGSIDGDPQITLSRNSFGLGEEISIDYKYAPVDKNAWIGIYRKNEKPGGATLSYKWAYTDGPAGTLKFTINETNEYYAVLFKDGGYEEVTERIPFYFGPKPELKLNKTAYEEGEDIVVDYANAPGLSSDWIGIYKVGAKVGSDYSISWDYTPGGAAEGTLTLNKDLPKGYYFANYFLYGEYFEPAERVYFSVGENISSVWLDKEVYTEEDSIRIYYQDGPGTPKDWVGVYAEGEDPNVDELDGFYYTYGATDGYVTIPKKTLKPGRYFCSLFINDSYDEVSERKYFTVDQVSGISDAATSDNGLCIRFREDGQIEVSGSASPVRVELINLAGRVVKRVEKDKAPCTVGTEGLAKGVYIVRVRGAQDRQTAVQKIVVD